MKENRKDIKNIVEEGAIFTNVSKAYLAAKRLLDIITAFLGLVVFSPFFAAIAVAVKIDSPGPVFHIQERCGLKGRIFKVYRFRTTVRNVSELPKELGVKNEANSSMIKIKTYPKITRVGGIIRKMGINELPQLISVLKGDLSLVGPYSPLISETSGYENWQKLRFSVKPGLTGLWKVSERKDMDLEELIRLDLKYIRERSLRNDIKILIKTMLILIRR